MPRKNKRKPKVDLLTSEKLKKLQVLKEDLHEQEKEYVACLNAQCKAACDRIYKLYDDHLKAIPENMRNMTIKEFMDLQQQQKTDPECDELESVKESLKSNIERHKLMSEKKKVLRLSKLEKSQRKRSLSASASTSSLVKSKPGNLPNTFGGISRVLSESNLHTPSSKKSVAPAFAVTPKFNPKSAVNKMLLRKPRAGEVIMSLSGSPLHNIMDEIAGKPGLAVSLGCGKVVNIMADKEVEKLQMDDDTKVILESAKQKLEEILNSD